MSPSTHAVSDPQKYDYIDALRGYAVLLVILVHVGAAFPELPWPVKRYTNLGWYGVQLFFLVSSLTLAMSWHSRDSEPALRTVRFFIRRFFRIAPMYYIATAYYLIVRPPGDLFSVAQLITSSIFIHGWSPGTIPTSDESWTVVPGSWSVAAEFGFYLLFPLLITIASTWIRALMLLGVSLPLAYVANQIGFAAYIEGYGYRATDQFLFFWLPNQLPVFLSGLVLYHILDQWKRNVPRPVRRYSTILLIVATIGFLLVPYLQIPRLPLVSFPYIPIHLLVAWVFCVAIVALVAAGRHFLVNPAAIWMGRVSFSAYLLHFSVIPTLAGFAPSLFRPDATGVFAIAHCLALFVATVLVTFAVSFATYLSTEIPMINIGKRLSGRLSYNAAVVRRA